MRIEVVTEGVLVRRLQRHRSLPGVGLVILDEFHERSLLVRSPLQAVANTACISVAGLHKKMAGYRGDCPCMLQKRRPTAQQCTASWPQGDFEGIVAACIQLAALTSKYDKSRPAGAAG